MLMHRDLICNSVSTFYNPAQNIWIKLRKPSNIGQDQKTLIFAFKGGAFKVVFMGETGYSFVKFILLDHRFGCTCDQSKYYDQGFRSPCLFNPLFLTKPLDENFLAECSIYFYLSCNIL